MPDSLNLLLIDDDEVDRRAARRAIRNGGVDANIEEASSVAAALEALRCQHYDCIVLDYQLPDGDGLSLLRTARSQGIATPVVMLTGHGDEFIAVELMKAGAIDYLAKASLTPDTLALSLRNAIRVHNVEEQTRQAQESLRANEEFLSAALRSIGDAIIATDLQGGITFMNPIAEALTGWTQTEAFGNPLPAVYPIISEVTREPLENPVVRVLHDGQPTPLSDHTILVARNGKQTDVEDMGSPMKNGEGTLTGAVLMFRDVSERKKAEAALHNQLHEIAALNQRLQRAMTETHHRVRNNLQIIAAMLDMRTMDHEDAVPAHEVKQLARHIHILSLVHDLLTSQAKKDSEAQALSSQIVLERLLPMLQQTAGKRPLTYDLEDTPLTPAQSSSLAIVVNELVSNALKYGHDAVDLTFRIHDGQGILTVSDDGDGFPPQFNPQKAARTGLDLVLSLAKWDLHGSAQFQNRPEGGGQAVVTLRLSASTAA